MKPTILYIAVDPSMGGSTASLYNLIDAIRNEVNPIVLFREEGIGVDYYREHGIECYIYPFLDLTQFQENKLKNVWRHPWRWHYIKKLRMDYACCKYVKEILNDRKIDIVHTNTSVNDIGIKLAKMLRAKHIWHVRECLDIHSNTPIYRGMAKQIAKVNSADGRIAISNFVAQHWQMKNDGTWVINDAIRSKEETCYISGKEKYLLFCSYFLTEWKGARRAIEAFAFSGVVKNGYKLILIGNCDDEYRDSLFQTAQKCGIKDRVEIVPCQKDVKPYFAKATAYIMASEFEGLGRVTAEAMFYGGPVIAHATGGTLDIVKDGETGYLFKTIEECAQLIRKVCTEPQEALILRAQKFAVDNLSQEVYGPKIMEVYNKVLKK